MPLYEYACEKCGEHFEVMQKFSDAALTTHEKCGGPVHRLISAPALQFKGSGWYVTDYARGSKSGDNGGAKKSEGSGEAGKTSSESGTSSSTASSENKSESKPSSSDTK